MLQIRNSQSKNTPLGYRRIQKSINGIRKHLSALAEIKRDEMKTQNTKRNRLLRKNNIKEGENLDQVIEELKQKLAAKTQRFSKYRKRQN
jgi:di/tripeptidase